MSLRNSQFEIIQALQWTYLSYSPTKVNFNYSRDLQLL